MNRVIKLALLPVAIITLAGTGMVVADRDGYDDDYEERGMFSRWMGSKAMHQESAHSALYKEECGSCHFPFQPGFLPGQSWQTIMSGLEDHFGENAEVSEETAQDITSYLLNNAADRNKRELSKKMMWSLRHKPNLTRITETAFFRHEHDEIPAHILRRQEPQVSFVNCDSCHTRALQGSYREREIKIPGIGYWDD